MVEYLLEVDCIDEVMALYQQELGPSPSRDLELCELIAKYPDQCHKLKGSPVAVLRAMLEKY